MEAFPKRDLKAYAAEPMLMYPTHYTFEAGYISDTEKSAIIQNEELFQQAQCQNSTCPIKEEL